MEQHVTFRRVAGMLVGIVIISLGVALFKFAHLGNDPFNALNIRSAELAGLTLGVQNLIYNAVFFFHDADDLGPQICRLWHRCKCRLLWVYHHVFL